MKIRYLSKHFARKSEEVIDQANVILQQYATQGFDLTLRQLFYQFVARAILPNTQRSYKRLGDIVSNGRLAGLIDWSYLVDRTRQLRGVSHWGTPSDIMNSCAQSFRQDKWRTQPTRVEIWIEKDALVGVLERVCTALDVDYFSCRGYTSQSEMWVAGRRLRQYVANGQEVTILHLGDHDPSGIDMTRDIRDRVSMFAEGRIDVQRIALNMDQVQQYNPPPNPAKITDSRATAYIDEHGPESWELDALDPQTLSNLITGHVEDLRDDDEWEDAVAEEQEHRELLGLAATQWPSIADRLRD